MDTMTAILTRRSIRKFLDKIIPDDAIETILKAAMYAPSAGNQQPWEFVVIEDRDTLSKITEVHPHSKMLLEAPVAILICGNLSRVKHEGFWVQDCSAAAQNLLLAAHSLGLGSVWLGVYPRGDRVEGMKKLLELPENVWPLAIIALGYPGEKKEQPDRFDGSRIHFNKWSG
jgi:nitroreductase